MSNKLMSKNYVLFGCSLDDEDCTAYFGKDLKLVQDLSAAMVFPSKRRRGQKGFGMPKQWLAFINEDKELNHNFKFHLVAVNDSVTKD